MGLLPRKHFICWGLHKAGMFKSALQYKMPRSLGMKVLYSSSFYSIFAFALQIFYAGLLLKGGGEIKCDKHSPHALMVGMASGRVYSRLHRISCWSLYQPVNTVLTPLFQMRKVRHKESHFPALHHIKCRYILFRVLCFAPVSPPRLIFWRALPTLLYVLHGSPAYCPQAAEGPVT